MLLMSLPHPFSTNIHIHLGGTGRLEEASSTSKARQDWSWVIFLPPGLLGSSEIDYFVKNRVLGLVSEGILFFSPWWKHEGVFSLIMSVKTSWGSWREYSQK